MAERFGTFRDFLKKYDDKVSEKKRPEIMRINTKHYDKYGSSDEEDYQDEAEIRKR